MKVTPRTYLRPHTASHFASSLLFLGRHPLLTEWSTIHLDSSVIYSHSQKCYISVQLFANFSLFYASIDSATLQSASLRDTAYSCICGLYTDSRILSITVIALHMQLEHSLSADIFAGPSGRGSLSILPPPPPPQLLPVLRSRQPWLVSPSPPLPPLIVNGPVN